MGLLALLAEGPSHGYHLKAGFEERTGGVWTLNVGQVYTTLDRLRTDGLVEPTEVDNADTDGRDRRPWRITRNGKEALEAWFDEAAVDAVPPRDEFLVKVLLALGRSRSEALAVIERQRTELYRLTQAARRRRNTSPPDGPAKGDGAAELVRAMAADLMADAVASRHEADLRWLDHCEELIVARAEAAPTTPINQSGSSARSSRSSRHSERRHS